MLRLLLVALCAIVASCSITPSPQDPAVPPESSSRGRFGVGIYAGRAEASDDVGVEASGGAIAARFDATLAPQGGRIEFGLRTGFGSANLDVDNFPPGTYGQIDATQFVFGPLVRVILLEPDSKVRPFVEGAVGYQRTELDEFVSTSSSNTRGSDSDSGIWFSLGLGIDVRATENVSWFVSFAFEHSELSDLDADTDTYGALVGARIGF